MGGIHPRLKRPVGRRLAVAAVALLHPSGDGPPTPLTGPTIAGCRYEAAAGGGGGGKLQLMFNQTLLGDDDVLVQEFNTNTSEWAGVDSLTAMVCGSSPPPAPGSLTCEEKCQAAGHCASGLVSCGQQPSCAQGCAVAG